MEDISLRLKEILNNQSINASEFAKKINVQRSSISHILNGRNKPSLEIVTKEDPCTLPKACKNDTEIRGMKTCHIKDAVAECNFLFWLDNEVEAGRLHNEAILSDKLDDLRTKLEGFRGKSFGTISAAAKNAAMCHYSHTNYEVPGNLQLNSVYLVDSGGQYLDGTTDITRTVAIGDPSDFIKKTFTDESISKTSLVFNSFFLKLSNK